MTRPGWKWLLIWLMEFEICLLFEITPTGGLFFVLMGFQATSVLLLHIQSFTSARFFSSKRKATLRNGTKPMTKLLQRQTSLTCINSLILLVQRQAS
jgi:hypothetical protein